MTGVALGFPRAHTTSLWLSEAKAPAKHRGSDTLSFDGMNNIHVCQALHSAKVSTDGQMQDQRNPNATSAELDNLDMRTYFGPCCDQPYYTPSPGQKLRFSQQQACLPAQVTGRSHVHPSGYTPETKKTYPF